MTGWETCPPRSVLVACALSSASRSSSQRSLLRRWAARLRGRPPHGPPRPRAASPIMDGAKSLPSANTCSSRERSGHRVGARRRETDRRRLRWQDRSRVDPGRRNLRLFHHSAPDATGFLTPSVARHATHRQIVAGEIAERDSGSLGYFQTSETLVAIRARSNHRLSCSRSER